MPFSFYGSFRKAGHIYRNFERFIDIGVILLRFGVGDLLSTIGLDNILQQARRRIQGQNTPSIPLLNRAERLRLALEELGPTFVKFGQLLSSQGDRLPPQYLKEFAKLQDKVPAIPYEQIEKIIKEELEANILIDISPTPLAAASIGQVHLAKLSANGQEIVIKIQRPNVRQIVKTDLEILDDIAKILQKNPPSWMLQDPVELVHDFKYMILAELDYSKEINNLEYFKRLYQDNPLIKIPTVYREACSKNVLAMERLLGIKSDNLNELLKNGYDPIEVANIGATLLLEQILHFGIFHGDPHPGNLFILPGPKIGMLDLGVVGHLDKETRYQLVNLGLAAVKKNPNALTRALLELTDWDEEPNFKRLSSNIFSLLHQYMDRPLKEINIGEALKELFDLAKSNKLRLTMDLILLVKVIGSLEGLGRTLNPDFDVVKLGKPIFKKYYLERLNPKNILTDLKEYTISNFEFLKNLPKDLRTIIRLTKKGKLRLEFKHTGLDDFEKTIEKSSYRISFALIITALLISSSVVLHANVPPKIWGVPVFGISGYLGAAMVGIWMIYDYIINRK